MHVSFLFMHCDIPSHLLKSTWMFDRNLLSRQLNAAIFMLKLSVDTETKWPFFFRYVKNLGYQLGVQGSLIWRNGEWKRRECDLHPLHRPASWSTLARKSI